MHTNNNEGFFGTGLFGWFRFLRHYLVIVPLQLFYSAVTNAFTFVCKIFFLTYIFILVNILISFLGVLLGNPRLPITDPRADVHHFLDDVVAKQTNHDQVSFVNGSYNDVIYYILVISLRLRLNILFCIIQLFLSLKTKKFL